MAIILLALIIGFALNVLIAWACAAWSKPDATSGGHDPQMLARLRREFFERTGPDPEGSDPGTLFVTVAHEALGVEFLDVLVEDDDIPMDWVNGPLLCIGYVRAGWPLRCFEAEWHHDASRSPTPLPPEMRWGAPLEGMTSLNRLFIPRMLPLRPRFSATLLNTLLWAGIIAGLIFSRLALRRSLRQRRRQCLACGYPLGDSPQCSECGREIRRRARRWPANNLSG